LLFKIFLYKAAPLKGACFPFSLTNQGSFVNLYSID